MSSMANPMIALLGLQQELSRGPIDPHCLMDDYLYMYDEPFLGGKRHSFAKIIGSEVQAVSIFGLEDPIAGVDCYNVGYAVNENHRGRGLAIEAVEKGLERLKIELSMTGLKKFYLEAVIDQLNTHSTRVAKGIFYCNGEAIIERGTGTPALHFKKLINI